jgi:hypothetical protein
LLPIFTEARALTFKPEMGSRRSIDGGDRRGVSKFLRKRALSRWHVTFEEMQGAVAGVLDRPGEYRDELSTLMTERFAIVEVEQAVA